MDGATTEALLASATSDGETLITYHEFLSFTKELGLPVYNHDKLSYSEGHVLG